MDRPLAFVPPVITRPRHLRLHVDFTDQAVPIKDEGPFALDDVHTRLAAAAMDLLRRAVAMGWRAVRPSESPFFPLAFQEFRRRHDTRKDRPRSGRVCDRLGEEAQVAIATGTYYARPRMVRRLCMSQNGPVPEWSVRRIHLMTTRDRSEVLGPRAAWPAADGFPPGCS